MISRKRFISGAILVLLAAFLLSAGCTQTSGPGAITATPTPSPVATAPIAVTTKTNVVSPAVTSLPASATANASADTAAAKTGLTALAGKFAREINGTALAAAAREGPNSTAFTTVLDQLRAFKATDGRLVYVYTVEQQNGTVRFLVDANYGLPGGSGFLEEYPDAPAELKKPLTAPVAAGPYTDSYGTFISGFAPIGTGANRTDFVVGVDMKA
jgi:hypothetical protein